MFSRDPGEWRVEWINDRDEVEVATFSGPNAHTRAVNYAALQYGEFDEIDFNQHS